MDGTKRHVITLKLAQNLQSRFEDFRLRLQVIVRSSSKPSIIATADWLIGYALDCLDEGIVPATMGGMVLPEKPQAPEADSRA